MIPVLDEDQKAQIEAFLTYKSRGKRKEIVLLDDASGVLVKQIKPNFKGIRTTFWEGYGSDF
jgi:isoleucyl-tRNA synthetase